MVYNISCLLWSDFIGLMCDTAKRVKSVYGGKSSN